jgi:hypothetical protein
MENYHNKELQLTTLLGKLEKQKQMLEDVVIETEKRKNQSEEEIKIFNEYGNGLNNLTNKENISSNYNSNSSQNNNNIYSSSYINTNARNSNLIHNRIIQ